MIPIYRGTVGLDTRSRPEDLAYDPESGVTALAKAVNVKIERTGDGRGRISRVHGYTEHTAGQFHSGFRDGGDAFVGRGTALYQFRRDKTLQGVRSGMTGERIAYAQHGDETYYGNGAQNGVIRDGVSYTWPTGTYLGPETTEHFDSAPVAKHLAIYSGRMFISPGDERNVLYASEPFQFGLFNKARRHWKFGSSILMIAPVKTGLFISDEHKTYFMAETAPGVFDLDERAGYPAFEWSLLHGKVDGQRLGLESNAQCRVWIGKEGLCLGTPDGQVINMTRKRIAAPSCGGYGATVLIGQNVIHSVGI